MTDWSELSHAYGVAADIPARRWPETRNLDRVRGEILATGGDVRCICDLFGMTDSDAPRYATGLERPDLTV